MPMNYEENENTAHYLISLLFITQLIEFMEQKPKYNQIIIKSKVFQTNINWQQLVSI